MEYIEYLRGIRRRRELVPHRAELDLFMGGRKIEFEERFDLNREIQKLKSMAMPVKARDLFHGRGIQLPEWVKLWIECTSLYLSCLCGHVCMCMFVQCIPWITLFTSLVSELTCPWNHGLCLIITWTTVTLMTMVGSQNVWNHLS